MKASNNNLIIKQNKSTFKLPTYDANEFPSLNKSENLKNYQSTINFINSIRKITPAIDNNNPKFELNGALLDIKKSKNKFCFNRYKKISSFFLQNIKINELN